MEQITIVTHLVTVLISLGAQYPQRGAVRGAKYLDVAGSYSRERRAPSEQCLVAAVAH